MRYSGHDYYLGPIGSEEARLAYADLLGKLAKDPAPPPPGKPRRKGLTVAELLERWTAYAQERYSAGGREASQFTYSLGPVLHLHATLPVASFAVAHLDEVREEMISRGWSRKVINRRIVRVRTVWRWGERKGYAPAGTWNALRALPPLDRADRRVPTLPPRRPVEWRDLAACCRQLSPIPRAMLLVQYYTGMRTAEVRTMRAGEIDRAGDIWLYTPTGHKCAWRGQARVIAIGPRAQKILGRFLEGKKPTDWIFESRPGCCYTSESYPRAVARACERAGVPPFGPYATRHSHKQRVTRTLGLDAARASLGQSSLDTTDRYAAGQDARLAVDAARRLG